MGFIRLLVLVLFGIFSMVSCSTDEVTVALESLDAVILNHQEWRDRFDAKEDSLKCMFSRAESDSEKWEMAAGLYALNYHYDYDETLAYLDSMRRYAVTPEHVFHTRLNNLNLRMTRALDMDALEEYHLLDVSPQNEDMYRQWLSVGVNIYYQLYKHDVSGGDGAAQKEKLQDLRLKYLDADSTSFHAKKIRAQYERENGNVYKALEIFHILYEEETEARDKASTAYNIATLYGMVGNDMKRTVWLARSAENDFKDNGRDYLSLYELSLMLYDQRRYIEASRYMELNMVDAFAGNFNFRYMDTSSAHVMIADAERDSAQQRMRLMISIVGVLAIFIIIILFLLKYSFRKRRKLKESRQILKQMNQKLVDVNHDLMDANRIKDGYVFRYMEMSLQQLKSKDEYKRMLNQTYKTEGIEAVVRLLRSRQDTYKEYDDYYRVFDEIFLGLYPDFVKKVNSLLREDAHFAEPVDNKLCTELRMLAVIRIGITESGRISTFLNCSPTTIYTYRTRLHRASKYPKEEFERLIRIL